MTRRAAVVFGRSTEEIQDGTIYLTIAWSKLIFNTWKICSVVAVGTIHVYTCMLNTVVMTGRGCGK